jgi:hypothetical protein
MNRQYRHYFDASSKTIAFPGAVIDKTLRQDDYSVQKGVSVFLENTVTGLVGMGLNVFTPDVTAPVLSTFTNSYSNPMVTSSGSFTDAETFPGDICTGYITVLLNGVTSTYQCTVTSGAGTITAVAVYTVPTGNTLVIKMSVADAAGNWVSDVKLGASYVV